MIPAVGYLRMSTDKQETSIADQRASIVQLAKREGYRVVAWYIDEGISGDATERRHEFLRMLKDARNGEWRTVLCWDQDRFGRFDSIEAGFWIKPLRDLGIWLHTVTKGRIDWDTFGGRLEHVVNQEAKFGYLRSLSENVNRGMLSKAHKGLALGMAPLGYCIVEQRYVIDEEAAALVRRIFDEYETGRSTTVIARGLNTEGVPTVRGAPWNAATILQILKRVAYAGTYRWNNGGNAQYSQVTGGIIAPVNKRAREKKLPDDAIVIEGHHEAIIDPKRFARIQKLLKANAKNTSPRGFDGPFILSGLLTCGRCGSAMHGRRRDDTRIVFYVCSKSLHEPGKCWTNAVRQDAALAEIVAGIRQEFSEESMAAVEAQIRELHSFERPGHSASLERRLVVVGSKIEKAKRRLVEVDRDMVGLVQQQIRELQGEQARLGAELAEASKTADSSAQEFRLHAAELADAMRRLEAMMETAPAREVRECLRTIISGAVVHTEAVRLGPKRTVSRLKFVEITAFC